MHRLLLLPVFLLLISPLAAAQEEAPDTVAAHRYVPLEVGNEWHYVEQIQWEDEPYRLQIWTISSSQPANVEECFRLEVRRYRPDGLPVDSWPVTIYDVYFDNDEDNIRSCTGGAEPYEYLPMCPLSANFNSWAACDFGEVWVTGPMFGVDIDGDEVDTQTKGFDTTGGESIHEIAVDIGLTFYTYWGHDMRLTYARVGDAVYGTPLTVSAEDSPAGPAPLALTVFPNPAPAGATVAFDLPAAQEVTLEVFDLLGRRVRQQGLGALPAGDHAMRLALEGLPAGLFVVRLRGDAGALATARLVRQRGE